MFNKIKLDRVSPVYFNFLSSCLAEQRLMRNTMGHPIPLSQMPRFFQSEFFIFYYTLFN